MKPAAQIRYANWACALLYGAGFWLLSFRNQERFSANPGATLLALALIFLVSFSASAWFINRVALQRMKARPWALGLAALLLPLFYFYIATISFVVFEYWEDLVSGKLGLAEFFSAPIESFLWVAAAALPISLFCSLVLAFIFVRAARSHIALGKDK